MQEIWKDVVGYEGVYQVSNLGNVRSLPKIVTQKSQGGGIHTQRKQGKILTPVKNSKGYYRVVMYNQEAKGKRAFVHRLVASHFIDNPDNKPTVNHIDGDKTNNKVDNLEWMTSKENSKHASENKLFNQRKGEDSPNAKLTEYDVKWILNNAIKGDRELGFKALARKFNVTPQHIGNIVSKKKWGYIE